MGYYKNQEIASQIEEADRKPRPASSHVAFPTRRLERQIERYRRPRLSTGQVQVILAWLVVAALALGIIVGVSL